MYTGDGFNPKRPSDEEHDMLELMDKTAENGLEFRINDVSETMLMWIYDGLKSTRDRLMDDMNKAVHAENYGPRDSRKKAAEDLMFLSHSLGMVCKLMSEIEESPVAC